MANDLLGIAREVFGDDSPQAQWISFSMAQELLKTPADFLGYVDRHTSAAVALVLNTPEEKVTEFCRRLKETISQTDLP